MNPIYNLGHLVEPSPIRSSLLRKKSGMFITFHSCISDKVWAEVESKVLLEVSSSIWWRYINIGEKAIK